MRKWMFYTIVLLITTPAFAQQIEPQQPAPDFDAYLKKSKKQKTAAWVLTGVGTGALAFTGLVAAFTKGADATLNVIGGALTGSEPERQKRSFAAPLLISSAAIVGGIVLFSSAAKNKKMAANASVYLNVESLPALN